MPVRIGPLIAAYDFKEFPGVLSPALDGLPFYRSSGDEEEMACAAW